MFVVLTLAITIGIVMALPESDRQRPTSLPRESLITIDNFTPIPRAPKPHGTLTEKQKEWLRLPR